MTGWKKGVSGAGGLAIPILAGVALLSVSPDRAAAQPTGDPAPAAPEEVGPRGLGGEPGANRRWDVILGAGPMIAPIYEGSDEFRVTAIPLISATFGEQLVVDPRGVSVTVFSDEAFGIRLRAGYDRGRDEDDSDRLTGLGDIDPGVALGATFAYDLGQVELRTSIGRIFGGNEGTIGDVGAEVSGNYGPVRLTAGASAIWADTSYMDTNFGITPAQSARSGLAAYSVDGGFRRVQADASAAYMLTANWAVRGRVVLGALIGDAADSPVVEDVFQPSAMLMLGYRF
jgi:outer membrane scaffolding protein for murein synthesis (MipA/OmpV family)